MDPLRGLVLGTAIATIATASCGPVSSPGTQAGREKVTMEVVPTIELEVHSAPDHLEIRYSFLNRTTGPILIFDRFYDLKKEALDPGWVYVEIAGEVAMLKRQMELLPRGLHFDDPPVPYAREIAPGGKTAGSFKLPIPILESGPYNHIVKRGKPREVRIQGIEMHMGWCPKPGREKLPPVLEPWEQDGERLLLLPYGTVAGLQKVSKSARIPVNLKGSVKS